MKPNKLSKILTDLGLSEHEALVYIASLSLGPTTILKLSEASEVKRTTVYSVVEALQHKGLMSIEVRGFKQLYVAENPEKLEAMIQAKRAELKSSMPEFQALFNLKGGESFIRYYEGLEAVKNIYTQITKDCRPHEEILVISDQESWFKSNPVFFHKYLLERAQSNIKARKLLVPSEDINNNRWGTEAYNEEIRLLPAETKLVTNLVITPRKVLIHQLVPPVLAIEIENLSVVQMNKEMFEIMWKSANSEEFGSN